MLSPDNWLRPLRLAGLSAAAFVLLGVGCGEDVDGSGADAAESISLIAQETGRTEIDLGDRGPSRGDIVVFDATVEYADGGEPAGRMYGTQTSVALSDSSTVVQAAITFDLPDGTISIGGVAEYPSRGGGLVKGQEFVRPIVGGTGAYAGATGQATTKRDQGASYEHQLQLEG